ncbi:hypothetical protein M3Y98_00818100 [Aphelenchoides besseyi]|nr:hypothetical protein M3Y98_00818100 [Aphelenchoides besseyi]KAI6212192.1 hypothetical protein M3Y96_00514300 [Aphelenchoides besseyi]
MPLRRFLHSDVSDNSSASSPRRPSTVSSTTMTPLPPQSFQRLGSPCQHAAATILAHALQARRFGHQEQNDEITYTENSERTPPPSAHDRQPLHRTTSQSASQNGSPPSAAWNANDRRQRRAPRHHGSTSNVSEFTAPPIATPTAGPLVVYQPEWPPMLSRAPSLSQLYGFPAPPPPVFPPPFFYSGAFPAHSLPPMDPKSMRKAMKHAQKMEKKRRQDVELALSQSGCCWYCCDGVAKLLWAIILITLIGFIAALILAINVL